MIEALPAETLQGIDLQWVGGDPGQAQEAAFLADRILILNGPPAQVAHEIEVRIPRPRNPEDPGLFDIHRQVISLLT
jgi:hypothetical protein